MRSAERRAGSRGKERLDDQFAGAIVTECVSASGEWSRRREEVSPSAASKQWDATVCLEKQECLTHSLPTHRERVAAAAAGGVRERWCVD